MERIDIIGGGLAGLTAAVVLGRSGKGGLVRVFEKKQYPCVKLCGEFLSPEGLTALSRVTGHSSERLRERLELRALRKFSWLSRKGRALKMDLEPGGWAVRRDVLDPWLAKLAAELGVEVRLGEVGTPEAPQQLWATGKEHTGLKSRYFAVKGYASDGELGVLGDRDISLFQMQGGYIGFTRMQGGELSYCALLDRERVHADWRYANWEQLREGIFKTNSILAEWTPLVTSLLESHVGAARFDFETRPAVRDGRWYVGDAVQLVPPFVGDGMAMAIEGGELAARQLSSGASAAEYQKQWNACFAPRVRVARRLHPMLWMSLMHEPAIGVLARVPVVARWIYARTRGYAA